MCVIVSYTLMCIYKYLCVCRILCVLILQMESYSVTSVLCIHVCVCVLNGLHCDPCLCSRAMLVIQFSLICFCSIPLNCRLVCMCGIFRTPVYITSEIELGRYVADFALFTLLIWHLKINQQFLLTSRFVQIPLR